MPQKPISDAVKQAVVEAIMLGKTASEISRTLGISTGSVSKIRRERGVRRGEAPEDGTRFSSTLGEESGSLNIDTTYETGKKPRWLDITSPEMLLEKADIDRRVWMVSNVRITSSEVTVKLREQVGKVRHDKPVTFTNMHISVSLKRRCPSEQAIEATCERLLRSKIKPTKVRYKTTKEPVLLEWCPYDHHHGLLAWAPEVEASWDLKISEDFFDKAAIDVLNKAAPYNISRILIPIGQDWFHCDDPTFQTPAGKHRLDIEGRLIKVFETGYWSLFRGIERFRQIAPVDLIWVPGNHDPQTSYYLARALAAHYMDVDGKYRKGVTVDFSPRSRKLYRWGTSAIGFSHPMAKGHWEKQRGIFSELFKREWAEANHHEIHTGHLHKIMELEFMQADTLGSHTVIRMLPSLCASDKWHHEMGFLDKNRASASFLWSENEGLMCQFTTRVRA